MKDTQTTNELFPGLSVEEMRALFFASDALVEPGYKVYQLNSENHRYYYRYDVNGNPELYPSVTTLLKQVMPTPPALLEWMIANGKNGSIEKRDLAAAYGTFMHGQFERLIISREYDFDDVPGILLEYLYENNISPENVFSEWVVKIRKDVLAFAQFVKDYNVKPYAVEIALVHPEKRFAGCLDLPCEMTDPKTGEIFSAIVDFKSGRKGFFEEHELQLHLYKDMWNYNFPGKPVTRVFNFSPKDWRTKPTYNLKDQTDSENAKKLPHLLALAAIEDEKRNNTLTIIRGVLKLDTGKIADNILTLSLSELIKSKSVKDESHERGANIPEIPAQAPKTHVNETKAPEPINSPSEPEKPVKTENKEKRLIRAGGPPTPYDVCDRYCREKNCDFRLGEHGKPCIEAKARAGYVEPESDRLPWEKEESEQAPAGPIMYAPAPEPAPETSPITDLFNDEIEM